MSLPLLHLTYGRVVLASLARIRRCVWTTYILAFWRRWHPLRFLRLHLSSYVLSKRNQTKWRLIPDPSGESLAQIIYSPKGSTSECYFNVCLYAYSWWCSRKRARRPADEFWQTGTLALLFFFLLGVLCPLICWLITRRYPDTILNYVKWVSILYPIVWRW